MKSSWFQYPLSVFAAAMCSTVGGVITVWAGLALGASLGFYILENEWIGFLGAFFMSILVPCVACMQVWGILYLGGLAYIIYRTLYGDAFRWGVVYLVTVLQMTGTLVAWSIMGSYEWPCAETWLRACVVYGVFVVLLIPTILMRRHMRKEADRVAEEVAEKLSRQERAENI